MRKNVLVVYAYPNHDSLNHEILQRVTKGLKQADHSIQILDLYKENFNPILNFDKEHRRRDLQYNSEMKPYRDQILWADHIIYIYPIWWGGMPAILKGYFDRVFSTGFSYHFHGPFPKGHLKGKCAWIITTDDTLPLFRIFALQDYGLVLKRQILRIMNGITVKKHIRFSYVKGRNQDTLEKWLTKCEQLSL